MISLFHVENASSFGILPSNIHGQADHFCCLLVLQWEMRWENMSGPLVEDAASKKTAFLFLKYYKLLYCTKSLGS
jgi:hypothetical protein